MSRHPPGPCPHPFALEQVNFLAAAVALVTANMGKAETMESELESAGGRDASQFREMDVGLADVALSANRETSAFQEPTQKSFQRRWFLTLMQNEGARPRPRHESPVQAHPCFFNRFRAGVVSCVGAQAQSPGDWLGGLCPREMPNTHRFASHRLHTTKLKPSVRLCSHVLEASLTGSSSTG